MSIMEADRKITHDQIAAGFGPVLAKRLGIDLKPVNGLTCTCGHATGCTCRLAPQTIATITHDAARSSDTRLLVCVLALKHLDDRLSHLESLRAGNPQVAQGQQPHDIVANAAQKAAQLSAELYRDKIENAVTEHREKKADQAYRMAHGDPSEPGHAHPQQRPDIGTEAHKHNAPLDESSGDGRQKTTQFPLGKSRISNDGAYVTAAEAKKMFDAYEAEQKARRAIYENECAKNRAFHANQHALIRDMKSQIERGMRERG